MKVSFHGNALTHTAGEDSFTSDDAQSIRALIKLLARRYGEDFRAFLLGDETCFFLVNGKGLMSTGGLDTELRPDDLVEVLPFVHAG